MFKPHHLELIYYVAKHRGISAASRAMPYGIGQPAISGQIADLERQLHTCLFERKPFRLTEPGRVLFEYVESYFDGLPALEEKLQSQPGQTMRIATDNLIEREFLPVIMSASRSLPPGTGLELRTAPTGQLEKIMSTRRAHLGIAVAGERIHGIRSLILAQAGLCLLVPRKKKIHSVGYFWDQKVIKEPLICPLEAGSVRRHFERGLQGLQVNWPVSIQADSHSTLLHLVAQGHGIGLGIDLPSQAQHPGVRTLPLSGFQPVPLVALWAAPVRPWCETLLTEIRKKSGALWGD